MGNSITRQVLTAAVTLSLFTLGTVGVATAGVTLATNLQGTIKGKEWCGIAGAINLGNADGEKIKFKGDFDVWIDFSDFPDIDALLDLDPVFLDFDLDGYAIPKNDKKGFFVIEGQELIGLDFYQLVMTGDYKNSDNGVPTKINGTFSTVSHINEPLDPLFDEICVSQKGGKFSAKGDGDVILIPD